jgi:DNA-directed RNA polymerase subunit RPC12/RpoP
MSHICVTCGTQYATSNDPPAECPICKDERQYIGRRGQEWITLESMQKRYRNVFFLEGERLWGIHTEPEFAIGQRALLLQTLNGGGFLWDCVSLVDSSSIELVKALGGLSGIAVSHPHYYASMVEWSRAFGGIPIYLHEADRQWVQFPDPAIVFWKGETHRVNDDLTLIRVGGHFSGFQVLHWASAENGSGALLTGDMPQVCPDRRFVSFMYSYPNLIPVDGATVRDIVGKLEPYKFSRLYGAWPKFVVSGDAKTALKRSAERYLRAIGSLSDRKTQRSG